MIHSRKKSAAFLAITLIVLCADVFLVAVNHYNDRQVLEDELRRLGEKQRIAFDVSLSMTMDNMLQIATFVAARPETRTQFADGIRALSQGWEPDQAVIAAANQDGIALGTDAAAFHRMALYESVRDSWRVMTDRFAVRQLHFHIAPGDRSYLRVHKPERHADDLSDLRHMIMDVNRDQQVRRGFELGRVYSGIRGAVPVYAPDGQHIGALEAGTSFNVIIDALRDNIGSDLAVTLNSKRVKTARWGEAWREDQVAACGCYLEAGSSATVIDIIDALPPRDQRAPDPFGEYITQLTVKDATYSVFEFPLIDYIGERDEHVQPVGRVFVWTDITPRLTELREATWTNIYFAAGGFALVELVIFFGVGYVVSEMRAEIGRRAEQVAVLNQELLERASKDGLTGALNRRSLLHQITGRFAEAGPEDAPFTMILVDLDRLTDINFEFGMETGDELLTKTVRLMSEQLHNVDLVGRIGSDQFAALLPKTDLVTAVQIAERIHHRVPRFSPENRPLSCSIGVAERQEGQSAQQVLEAALAALSRAKEAGGGQIAI